jgi:tetratricopeptide (TPR) repeat protein
MLYEEGNYQGAILAFQSSFDISHAPALYYNIANCYERLGKLAEARDALNLYRAVAPADERDRLERRIANLEDRIRTETPTATTTTAPPPQTTTTAPPNPAPAATKPANNTAKWVLVGTGGGVAVAGGALAVVGYVRSADARTAGDQARYENDRLLNEVGYGVAGAGLAAAVVGLVLPTHQSAVSLSTVPMDGGMTLMASIQWPVRNRP